LGCVCSSILDVTTGRPTVTEVLHSASSIRPSGVGSERGGGLDQMGFARDVAVGVISLANKKSAAAAASAGSEQSRAAVSFITVSCGVTQTAVLSSPRARMAVAAAIAQTLLVRGQQT
jgi:hypothetical protein